MPVTNNACNNACNIQEGSQIASILEKVMYCGAYLGREGLDFRPAICQVPLFGGGGWTDW